MITIIFNPFEGDLEKTEKVNIYSSTLLEPKLTPKFDA